MTPWMHNMMMLTTGIAMLTTLAILAWPGNCEVMRLQQNHMPLADSKSLNKKKPAKASHGNADFHNLISMVNQRNEYNTEGCIYIDSDIHDLLSQIKVRNKLKIGCLVSWLIEQFILEHKQEIAALLQPKENRFIDK